MAEQGAAAARPVEPNAQVVRSLESRATALKLWAAAMGIPVVDREGAPIHAPDLARAVATALVMMTNRPACSNPVAVLFAAQLYTEAAPTATQCRKLATGFYEAHFQGTPAAETWRRLSNSSMAIFATIEAANAGQES